LSHTSLARIVTSSLQNVWLLRQPEPVFTNDFQDDRTDIYLATRNPNPKNISRSTASFADSQSNTLTCSQILSGSSISQSSRQFTMSSNVLADRDVNAAAPQQPATAKGDIKTMEYHRQVLQSKLDEEQYVDLPLL
jgi:hypothetical protein